MIVANEAFPRNFGARPRIAKPTTAAGLRAQFLVFDLGARSGRGRPASGGPDG